MRERVTRHMRQVSIMEITTTDANSNSEEESQGHGKKRWPLKSGKLRIADSIVVHKVVWMHEIVFTSQKCHLYRMARHLFRWW